MNQNRPICEKNVIFELDKSFLFVFFLINTNMVWPLQNLMFSVLCSKYPVSTSPVLTDSLSPCPSDWLPWDLISEKYCMVVCGKRQQIFLYSF